MRKDENSIIFLDDNLRLDMSAESKDISALIERIKNLNKRIDSRLEGGPAGYCNSDSVLLVDAINLNKEVELKTSILLRCATLIESDTVRSVLAKLDIVDILLSHSANNVDRELAEFISSIKKDVFRLRVRNLPDKIRRVIVSDDVSDHD